MAEKAEPYAIRSILRSKKSQIDLNSVIEYTLFHGRRTGKTFSRISQELKSGISPKKGSRVKSISIMPSKLSSIWNKMCIRNPTLIQMEAAVQRAKVQKAKKKAASEKEARQREARKKKTALKGKKTRLTIRERLIQMDKKHLSADQMLAALKQKYPKLNLNRIMKILTQEGRRGKPPGKPLKLKAWRPPAVKINKRRHRLK